MARGSVLPEWQRAVIALSATFVMLVVVAALYWARTILMPVALAIFISFVLGPLVVGLQRRGLGRTFSVVAVVGLASLVAVGSGALIVQQVAHLSENVAERKDAVVAKLTDLKTMVVGSGDSRVGKLVDDVTAVFVPKPAAAAGQTPGEPPVVVQSSEGPSWIGQVGSFVSPATEALGQVAFAFVLTVFMLLKREDLRNRMIRLIGHGRVTTTTKAIDDASKRVSRYLLMQLLLNTGFGLVVTLSLFAIGVKYALLWGFLSTLMRYVPYVGTVIGSVLPILYTLAVSDGWGLVIAVAAVFLVLELLCNNVFEPWLYGQSMGLSEVAQLVAAGFWAFLWGPIGLILSGPLTVCLLVLGKYVSKFQFLEVLLGDEPALEPKVAFYQRLAARDQDEASQVATKEAKDADLDAVYDRLLVPALALAKRDHDEAELSDKELDFVLVAAREIGEELALDERADAPPPAAVAARPRVLICPAKDEADRVASELLALTLDPTRWEVQVTTSDHLASELLDEVAAFRPQVVCVGSVPPGGMAHSRYLCARLRSRFPDLKLVLGRWGGDELAIDGDAQPTPAAAVDLITRSVGETLRHLNGLLPVFSQAQEAEVSGKNGKADRVAVGTAGASA